MLARSRSSRAQLGPLDPSRNVVHGIKPLLWKRWSVCCDSAETSSQEGPWKRRLTEKFGAALQRRS